MRPKRQGVSEKNICFGTISNAVETKISICRNRQEEAPVTMQALTDMMVKGRWHSSGEVFILSHEYEREFSYSTSTSGTSSTVGEYCCTAGSKKEKGSAPMLCERTGKAADTTIYNLPLHGGAQIVHSYE